MFVSCSDLHLREEFSATLPEVRDDAYLVWEQIYNYAVSEKASGLIMAGDIFDGPPSAKDVSRFLRGVHRLREAGIKIYAVQGQHGRSKFPWTSIDPTNTVIDLALVEDCHKLEEGVFIKGFDTLPPDELQKKLSKWRQTDKTNVLVLHQMAKGCLPEMEGKQLWDYDPEWCPKQVDLVLLGDWHDQWETTTNGGKTRQIYHGSMWMRAINERPDKRFLSTHFVNGVFKTFSIKLNTRPFANLFAMAEEQMSAVLEQIAKQRSNTLIKLTYDPDVDDVEKRCREAATNEPIHFYFKAISKEAINPEKFDVEKLREISLSGCLDAMVDREKDAEFHGFMVALLGNPNTKDVLDATKARLIGMEIPATT